MSVFRCVDIVFAFGGTTLAEFGAFLKQVRMLVQTVLKKTCTDDDFHNDLRRPLAPPDGPRPSKTHNFDANWGLEALPSVVKCRDPYLTKEFLVLSCTEQMRFRHGPKL